MERDSNSGKVYADSLPVAMGLNDSLVNERLIQLGPDRLEVLYIDSDCISITG